MNIRKIRGFLSVLLIWRNLPAFAMYVSSDRQLIKEDLARELQYIPFDIPGVLALNYALLFIKPFRSVFRYRTVQQKPWLALFSWLVPRSLPGIEIDGQIEGGLLLYHKMGCVLSPYKAGKNLTISQGVTVGKGNRSENGFNAPVIGDNVQLCTNAVVFGGINIGNNVIVGAGTVLNKSVPDNCTVVGNPAHIVRKNGEKCFEEL
jgi:serine O-acetyltransferase